MDINYLQHKLDTIEQEIKDVLKEETKLKRKQKNGGLTHDEEIELEGMDKLLAELRSDKKFCRKLIERSFTEEVESKTFGNADDDWIRSVTGIDTAKRKWKNFHLDDSIIPCQDDEKNIGRQKCLEMFKKSFENTSRAFHMFTEAGRRIFLNLFLSDVVLRSEFNDVLRIFPELEISVETIGPKKRKLNGKTDYTIGYGKDMDIFGKAPPRELHLVAVEAKTSLGYGDFWQCVAEASALYKSRKDARKARCSVWGILTNATTWQFIHIDEDGLLWRSDQYILKLDEYDEKEVLFIYRFIYYVVKCCFEACTPTPTPNSSINDLVGYN